MCSLKFTVLKGQPLLKQLSCINNIVKALCYQKGDKKQLLKSCFIIYSTNISKTLIITRGLLYIKIFLRVKILIIYIYTRMAVLDKILGIFFLIFRMQHHYSTQSTLEVRPERNVEFRDWKQNIFYLYFHCTLI